VRPGQLRIVIVCLAWLAVAPPAHAEQVEARHLRIRTAHGPVHLWTPAGYDAANAGIVLYVHGFFTDVDHAWKDHELARQFADSGLNALFIACEAPSTFREPVAWTSPRALLAEVEQALDEALPQGPIVAVGHSGAHRTLAAWVEDGPIDTIAMLDAMYGEQPAIRAWLDSSEDRRLIDVSDLTRTWGDAFHANLPETKVFDEFPPPATGHLAGARDARIVYVHSQISHMLLISGGVALPMVLRATRINSLADSSREAPIQRL
jgi:hypothetical protein